MHETNYYATTTGSESIVGGAAGYPAYELVRQAGSSLVPSYSGSADTVPNLTVSGSAAAVLSYSQYFAHTGLLTGGTAGIASGGTQTIFPTARRTTFSDSSGTSSSAITYSYSYQWNSIAVSGGTAASLQVRQQTTTLPAISAAQNGPGGTGATRTEWYNSLGQLTWQMDDRGRVNFFSHDPLTGSLTQAILDISSSAASSLSPPSGWTIPGDGLSVTTSYQFDSLGRVNQVLGPPHYNDQGNSIRTANWTVYDDPNHIVYSAAGYQTISSSACTTVNPVSIQQYDAEGRPLASIEATSGTASNVGRVAAVAEHLDVEQPGHDPVRLYPLDRQPVLQDAARKNCGLLPHSLFRHDRQQWLRRRR